MSTLSKRISYLELSTERIVSHGLFWISKEVGLYTKIGYTDCSSWQMKFKPIFLFYVISWSILFLGCDSGWIPWERLFSRYTFCSDWLVIHIFFPSKQPKSLQVTLSGLYINMNYCMNMYFDQRKIWLENQILVTKYIQTYP